MGTSALSNCTSYQGNQLDWLPCPSIAFRSADLDSTRWKVSQLSGQTAISPGGSPRIYAGEGAL